MSQSTTEAATEAVDYPPIEVPARRKIPFRQSLRRSAFHYDASCSSGTSRMASWKVIRKTALGDRRSHRYRADSGPHLFGKWLNLASAYITGISVGILVRSPAYWPYALCSVISIMSKYVLASEGTAHLESVQLWHRGAVISGAGDHGRV